MINDISYGRDAEVWPRDYSMLARRIQFLRFNDCPVRLISCNGLCMVGYISKFNQKENLILASATAKGKERVEVKLETLAMVEELNIRENVSALMVNSIEFNSYILPPSRKDFFSICNKCFKQGVNIRVGMMNGQVIEGRTTGVNACQVGVLKSNGNHVQIMFDWVKRITSVDFSWE
ncbi:phase 1 flagellin transcriptional repressor [Salmonella enterica]